MKKTKKVSAVAKKGRQRGSIFRFGKKGGETQPLLGNLGKNGWETKGGIATPWREPRKESGGETKANYHVTRGGSRVPLRYRKKHKIGTKHVMMLRKITFAKTPKQKQERCGGKGP